MALAGDISGAVSDIFQAEADKSKARFDRIEGQEYSLASDLATQNEEFTQMSTAIKEAGENREVTQALGKTQAEVAGAGFATSGSALDILRSGAQQGAILKAVANEQGLITEAGFREQSDSYTLMSTAANEAAQAEDNAAKGARIGEWINIAAAVIDVGGAIAGGIPGGGGGSSVGGGKGP